jgi:hypothetical protein
MKKTHIFFGNQHIDSFNCTGKKYTKYQIMKIKIKSFFKKLLFWLIVILIAVGIGQYVRWAYPTTITKEVVKEVVINQDIKYPVLDRIAQCESGNKHFDKNGQVMLRGNTNKTVDVGVFQINSVWFAKATELGLDLTKEADNREFAKYLYTTRGTEDWKFSAKCWSK